MMISKDYTLAGLSSLEGLVQRVEPGMKARLNSMDITTKMKSATENDNYFALFWNQKLIGRIRRLCRQQKKSTGSIQCSLHKWI
ncbi:hypothetical protein BH10ACI3_BH10ACI3_20830 [soil metagenome]